MDFRYRPIEWAYWKRTPRPRLMHFLSLLLFCAAFTDATAQDREPDIDFGQRLVGARCVVCHGSDSLAKMVERCTNTHGEEYLDVFLKDHHAPDDDARADIIASLTCPKTPE